MKHECETRLFQISHRKLDVGQPQLTFVTRARRCCSLKDSCQEAKPTDVVVTWQLDVQITTACRHPLEPFAPSVIASFSSCRDGFSLNRAGVR